MAARILVAEDSVPVVAALRRALEGAAYLVDWLPPAAARLPEVPAQYGAAIVHLGPAGVELVRALRDLDPHLAIVGLVLDEEEGASLGPRRWKPQMACSSDRSTRMPFWAPCGWPSGSGAPATAWLSSMR